MEKMWIIKLLYQKGEKLPVAISELKPLPTTAVTHAMQITPSNGTLNPITIPAGGVLYTGDSPAFRFGDYAPFASVHGHYSRGMTNEQLRAAWLILFGSEGVWFSKIRGVDNQDDWLIAYETYDRGLLHERNDPNTYGYQYILKK